MVKNNIINNKELIVREAKCSDGNNILSYFNEVGGETDNLMFGKNEFFLSEEQNKLYIEHVRVNKNSIMIVGIIDGEIVSVSQVASMSGERFMHNANLGISVKKEFWKKGIASIVMKELIKFSKESSVIRNLRLTVKSDNGNARNLYKKFGFNEVGVFKNAMYVNGVYYNEIIMGLDV